MAKLIALPHQAIISGFKGTVDFYVNMGIPCARRWPRSPGHRRAPAVESQWPPFAWASSNWNSLSPIVQEAYRQTAQGTTLTGRDLFTKSYITDYFRLHQWGSNPPPAPSAPNFAILDLKYTPMIDGFIIRVTTSIACHLFLYHTQTEPIKQPTTRVIRGLATMAAAQLCFVNWQANEQTEEGDTLIHTFVKGNWPICETRWFTFRGTIAGLWSPSIGPIFKKHRTGEWELILLEPWTGTFSPPAMSRIFYELWSY